MSERVNCVVTDSNWTFGGDHGVQMSNYNTDYTSETYVMLYTNFISIKKIKGLGRSVVGSADGIHLYPSGLTMLVLPASCCCGLCTSA